MDSSGGSIAGILTKTQRLLLGSFILILVDVIWVASSELTKFIYDNEKFEKPFFCAYIKSSMLALYLLGFLFWPPWKDSCSSRPPNYIFIDTEMEEESYYADTTPTNRLSNPVYVPVKNLSDRANSDAESDDSSIRSVRFNKLAEVRHMSETEATEALLARLSYQATERAGEVAKRAATKLPLLRIGKFSFAFCLVWFMATYSYHVALTRIRVEVVNMMSSASIFWTIILMALLSSESSRCNLTKITAVVVNFLGCAVIYTWSVYGEIRFPTGEILELVSSFFYAAFLVLIEKNVDHEDRLDIPLFFGFVGFFNLILLWPFFFFLHFNEMEVFELPSRHQMLLLLLNGLLGTVVAETLRLWGCLLTCPIMAAVSMSLSIPMTLLADVFMKKAAYEWLIYFGTIVLVAAFVAMAYLLHYENWDPIYDLVHSAYYTICKKTRILRFRFAEPDSEQTEALIGISSGNEHEA